MMLTNYLSDMIFENKNNNPQQVKNKEFVADLKERIASLEITNESKEAEVNLLQSELHDTLSPAIATAQLNQLVMGMLMELTDFIQKKGSSKKTTESRVRLLKIIDLIGTLDKLSGQNYSLQCNHRFFVGIIARQRLENKELRQQIFNMQQAENFNGREGISGKA